MPNVGAIYQKRMLATRAEMAAAARAPKLSPEVAATKLLDRIEQGVASMAELNTGFTVTRTPGSIVIDSGPAAGEGGLQLC